MPSPQQSPINLRDALAVDLGGEGLAVKYKGKVSGLVVKEKDGAKVQFFPPYSQQIGLGNAAYKLASFHFHHPSEHLIDGEPSDLELHLVHTQVGDGIRYAVVAVMIGFDEKAPDPEERLHKFFHAMAAILKHKDPEGLSLGEKTVSLDPTILLPQDPERQPYYRYEGSLTTPEFDEAVSWVVMPPIAMRRSYFEELGLLRHIEKPARPPQPTYRRFILVNSPSGATPSGSEGSTTHKATTRRSGKKQV